MYTSYRLTFIFFLYIDNTIRLHRHLDRCFSTSTHAQKYERLKQENFFNIFMFATKKNSRHLWPSPHLLLLNNFFFEREIFCLESLFNFLSNDCAAFRIPIMANFFFEKCPWWIFNLSIKAFWGFTSTSGYKIMWHRLNWLTMRLFMWLRNRMSPYLIH